MKPQEAIRIMKTALAEVEWNYPMDYAIAFDMAIEALEIETHNCEDCRHAATNFVPNANTIYCLEHCCVMKTDNCCRDWSDEDAD